MTPPRAQAVHRNVVCPFCSLLCDDVEITAGQDALKMRKNGCDRSRRGFETPVTAVLPHVDGKPVDLALAISRAAKLLKSARQPLISGLATDVAGCRAALALAERCGAAIDHVHGDALLAGISAMQGGGSMSTTFTEARNRGDLFLLVGTDGVSQFPRFFERIVWPRASLATENLRDRKVILLGEKLQSRPGAGPGAGRTQVVPCGKSDLPECIAALLTLQRGGEITPGARFSERTIQSLRRIVTRLRDARYGVIAWAPADLAAAHGDLLIRNLHELVVSLNRTTRCAALPLGGNDGGSTCVNTTAWQTGFPLRVNFSRGSPHFDPQLNATARMLGAGAADALVWISGLGREMPPPDCGATCILLGPPSKRLAAASQVYLPVGTPGVDHAGCLFRADGVVSLPLVKLRESRLLPVAGVLDQIRERL